MPPEDGRSGGENEVRVSVVYATSTFVHRIALSLPARSSVRTAVQRSGLLQQHPELSLSALDVGIYGSQVTLATPLRDGDRVEIYRPLMMDPKEARRRRAAKRRLRSGSSPARCRGR
jgi:putative ubiquitin-RnfH superfamily antitoxin RatB of RatAB toxin-antitoxin module